MEEEKKITEEEAKEELQKRTKKAEELLKDKDKTEEFLVRLEEKFKSIPKAGNAISTVPVLISMVRAYIRKEYTVVPAGTIAAVVAALLYVFSPVDLIPDVLVPVGYIDDAAVVAACLALVGSDVKEYQEWREDRNAK